jgi:hypothetical protein
MRYGAEQDNITQTYRMMVRPPRALISASQAPTAAFMMPAARSHSLRCSDSEADARPRLYELLAVQLTMSSDPHSLCQHIIYDVLQHDLLACDIERR